MASQSHILTLFLTFLSIPCAASLPSFPTLRLEANNTHLLPSIERIVHRIPATDHYLDIYLSTNIPIDPVRFTDEIADQYRFFDQDLARNGDKPMFDPPIGFTGLHVLAVPYISRNGIPDFRTQDFVDVLITLQRVVVQPKKFFETFWYLRNEDGVAFASGLIAAERPPAENWNRGYYRRKTY